VTAAARGRRRPGSSTCRHARVREVVRAAVRQSTAAHARFLPRTCFQWPYAAMLTCGRIGVQPRCRTSSRLARRRDHRCLGLYPFLGDCGQRQALVGDGITATAIEPTIKWFRRGPARLTRRDGALDDRARESSARRRRRDGARLSISNGGSRDPRDRVTSYDEVVLPSWPPDTAIGVLESIRADRVRAGSARPAGHASRRSADEPGCGAHVATPRGGWHHRLGVRDGPGRASWGADARFMRRWRCSMATGLSNTVGRCWIRC